MITVYITLMCNCVCWNICSYTGVNCFVFTWILMVWYKWLIIIVNWLRPHCSEEMCSGINTRWCDNNMVSIFVCLCVHAHVCTCICVHAFAHACICMCVCTSISMCVYKIRNTDTIKLPYYRALKSLLGTNFSMFNWFRC